MSQPDRVEHACALCGDKPTEFVPLVSAWLCDWCVARLREQIKRSDT